MSVLQSTMPELDPSEKETIETYYRYLDPMTALNLEITSENFVEWEAEGTTIRDRHGRHFIDGMTFGGVFGLGHRHPKVVEAVKLQLDRMPLSSRAAFSTPVARLCRKLGEISPGDLNYCFISSSGTESIEVALKLARLTTQRPQLISMMNSYHGMSIGCASVSGIPYWREGFFPLLEGCSLVQYGDIQALENAINPMTAAVLLEPVQAASGCTVPPFGYLRQVRELCTRYGAMMITDEIQTGFGRTGKMFGVDHEDVVPDIMCLGKFLGGGVMPIGATVYNQRVHRAATARPNFNNTTFGGNPLSCAAAVAALEVVQEEKLVERSARLGMKLRTGLEKLHEKYPKVIAEIRGRGLMQTFALTDVRYALPLVLHLVQKERILLFSPIHSPHMFRVNPPQIVDDAFIEDMLGRIDRSVDRIANLSSDDLNRLTLEVQSIVRKIQEERGLI